MAKKIFASQESIDDFLRSAQAQLIKETAALKKRKFQTDDEREITLKFKMDEMKDDRKVEVFFTPLAWAKMYSLVTTYSSEVEWHGIVERTGDERFLIKDILIFPHEVTGATVTSNQQEYEVWLNDLDDDTFNALRFHGHSHVNMGVFPSSVDMGYRKNVLNNFGTPVEGTDYFYIFLITNKRGELSGQVYDLKNNVMYTKDSTHDEIIIDVVYDDGDTYLSEFLAEAKSVVKEAHHSTSSSGSSQGGYGGSKSTPTGGYGNYYGYGVDSYDPPRRGAKVTQRQIGMFGSEGDEYDDYDDPYSSLNEHGSWGGKK